MNDIYKEEDKRERTLTVADIESIAELIKTQTCPLSSSERDSVVSFYRWLKDVGEGDTESGVRRIRSSFNFIFGLQSKKNIVSGLIITVITVSLLGQLGRVFWMGLSSLFTK